MYAVFALLTVPLAGRRTLPGIFLGACLAVPMWAGTATPVRANCGDWLDHATTTSDGEAGGSTHAVTAGAASADVPVPPPCDGPHCGGTRHTPAPSAPAPTQSTSKDYGCRNAGDVGITSAPAGGVVVERTLGLLVRHPRRIDRPPRP